MVHRHGSKSAICKAVSDEKLLSPVQIYSAKRYVIYFAKFDDVPKNLQYVKRFQKKKYVILWTAVSNDRKLALKFTYKRIKIIAK